MDFAPNRGPEALGRAHCSHLEIVQARERRCLWARRFLLRVIFLNKWSVYHRRNAAAHVIIHGVPSDSDDFNRIPFPVRIPVESPADWIRPVKVTPRRLFVD